MAEREPANGEVRASGGSEEPGPPVPEIDRTEEWPDANPFGIARVHQSRASFVRGETAVQSDTAPQSVSVGVRFSNPTPPDMAAVGPSGPARIGPADVVGDAPPKPASPDPDGSQDPSGGDGEWSGWRRMPSPDEGPAGFAPPPTDAVTAEHSLHSDGEALLAEFVAREISPEGVAAAPATAWTLHSIDLEAPKKAGRAEPLVRLADEAVDGEEPTRSSEVAGSRLHSRAQERQEEEEEAEEAKENAKPPPRNISQFTAVLVLLVIMNVPAIMVLHKTLGPPSTKAPPPGAMVERPILSPEDLAAITDALWAKPERAEELLYDRGLTPDDYSREMVRITTNAVLNERYELARSTGPRGGRKLDLSPARPKPVKRSMPAPHPDRRAPRVLPGSPDVDRE